MMLSVDFTVRGVLLTYDYTLAFLEPYAALGARAKKYVGATTCALNSSIVVGLLNDLHVILHTPIVKNGVNGLGRARLRVLYVFVFW